MRVLYIWKGCRLFNKDNAYSEDNCDAYFVEIQQDEITEKLFELFALYDLVLKYSDNQRLLEELKNGKYYAQVNRFAEKYPECAKKDCVYILIDENVTKAMLCSVTFPYAGQWNSWNPFRQLYNKKTKKYLPDGIQINGMDEIKNMDEIIIKRG